ncbi:MAG: carbohydrate binding family 9 domain-containing protein [Armatimonadota bacterium]|nr:carbohydrate binding family 9 domain-containing protein [Armatimonadota bacterium]
MTATRTDAAPTLDGRLDEALWERARWHSGFTLLGETETPAQAQTQFAVAFDDMKLYFAVKCLEPNMDQLEATVTERDGKVHGDDCVELMVDPTGDRVEYYHFTVNPLGTLYDAQLRQGGNVRFLEWDCDWQAAVARGEDSWTVEAAIPFVQLALDEGSRDFWALNVARERRAGTQELSSFTEAPGGFHQPGFYAELLLPDADLGRYMWTVRDPFDVRVVMRDGQVLYEAKTHITNQTGRFWFIELRPELMSEEGASAGEPVSAGLDDGQGRELAFSVPVAEQGRQVLRLRIVDRRDLQRVLHVRSMPVDVHYTPLAIDITRPCYRNSIYATQDIDTVQFSVTSALSEEQLRGHRLTAGVFQPGGEAGGSYGRLVAGPESVPAAAEVQMSIPVSDLPVGDYVLGAQIVGEGGRVEHGASEPLRKLPPSPSGHEWRIDENLVLRHNGEPFLPFGWFSYRWREHDTDDPYTAMQDYNANWRSVEENRELFDGIAERGLFVTVYPYCREFMNRGDVLKRPLNDEEAEVLRERVTALMDHEALLAWYMADEPELRPVLPRRAEQIYQVVRDADPYHPCIMLNDTIAGIHTYAGGGDILMPDPYPLFLEGGLAARGIERTSNFVRAVREATDGQKPAWVTPQAFNYGDYGRAGNRAPTFTELRNQLYQAVVYGAKGFLWYTHSQAFNYPSLGIGMDFLCREALDLKAAILSPDAPDEVSVQAPQPEHMHVAVRRAGGELYVFAVSTATQPQEATVTVAGAPERLYVVSEGRRVELAEGAIADRFDVYATHIYTTDGALAERDQLEDVQRRIAEADAAREKPGNLAFEDSGVEVEISSGSRYGNTPGRVVDGIEGHMGWRADRQAEGDHWLKLTWPDPVAIGRVVIYSPSIAEAEIQVPDGEAWTTVATASGTDRLEATFGAVETTSLRILVNRLAGEASEPTIQEVEAYAQ